MAVDIHNIPPNAVQVLFAEDLVNRILYRHNGTPYETWRAGPYRNLILNAFTDDVKTAVDFIDMSLEWEIDEEFCKFVDNFAVNEKSFIDYAFYYEHFYFQKGFVADSFLHYCVRLVSMAAYFAQHNVTIAPDLSMFFIVKVIEKRDMFKGGWDTLNVVAEKYVKLHRDFINVLSPEISDDESLADSSNEEDPDQCVNNEVFYIINRDDLESSQQPKSEKHEFDVGDQSATGECLEPEISSKSESTSGQALEEILSSNEFDSSKMAKTDSTSKGNLETKKLLAANLELPCVISAKEPFQASEFLGLPEVCTSNTNWD